MIVLSDVYKTFTTGSVGLEDINLNIEKGEFVFLVGHTGSGKTTLLRLLIREYLPTRGTITIEDLNIALLPKNKIPHLRKKIGVIFQDLKLLMDKTILENVMLPLEIKGIKALDALKKAQEVLEKVGMISHKDKFPIQVSGGELQRVAIARALTLEPLMILADEPTGNLDTDTAFEIVDILDNINKSGTTIIMATHNMDILNKYPKNRVIKLDNGKMILDSKNKKEEKEKQKDENKSDKNDEEKSEKYKTANHKNNHKENKSLFKGSIAEKIKDK